MIFDCNCNYSNVIPLEAHIKSASNGIAFETLLSVSNTHLLRHYLIMPQMLVFEALHNAPNLTLLRQ